MIKQKIIVREKARNIYICKKNQCKNINAWFIINFLFSAYIELKNTAAKLSSMNETTK